MKKKLLLFIITIACTHLLLQAQSSTDHRIKLHSVNSIGLLNGSKGASFSMQSILGASVYRSFIGVGLGIDQYSFRSIPLFLDFRHEIGSKNRSVFLYGDAGYNFDWLTERNKNLQLETNPDINFRGGLYYDAGLGYILKFKSGDALLFSAGYCYKEMENKVGQTICPFIGPCNVTGHETYTYQMPRLLLKAGWMF